MSRRLRLATVWAATAGAAAFVVLTTRGETPNSSEIPIAIQALELVVALLYVIAGLLIWSRHPGRLVGRLLTAAGLALLAGHLGVRVGNAALFTAGMVAQSLFLALLAHAAVAYPSGRLASAFDRFTVAAAYIMILGENLLTDLSACEGCPRNLMLLPLEAGTFERVVSGQRMLTLAAIVLFVAALVRHLHQSSGVARRALAPVVVTAAVMAAAHGGMVLVAMGAPLGRDWVWWLAVVATTAAVPIAYLAARLRSRLAVAGVGPLVVELESGPLPGQLRAALARALGDPTVEVALWSRDAQRYVDAEGRPIALPDAADHRAVTTLERSGERVGALIHDPALSEEPALVHAVCAAAGLSIENERLQAEVRARLEEVRASRTRIVEAADSARRRVERNLHDGAQQRLVTLALALRMARNRLGNAEPEVDALLGEAAEELKQALAELRELGGGLHPAILAEEGLEAALDSLAERSPIAVDVSVNLASERPPTSAEVAAYFVVSEALANAAKHANASLVTVSAVQHNGLLCVEVVDDGAGGAVVRPRSGLEGLSDRVEALGGRLEVVSPPGHGTKLVAEIPCA